MKANPENHFCIAQEPPEALGKARAAIVERYMWPRGEKINIKFLEGDTALQAKVAAVAKEWTGRDMANLEFDFVDSDDADIRIAFMPGRGSWSYIGTDCQNYPEGPTMNFGWLTADSSDDEIRRVVLHEFGHAIGLIHEHQNPKQGIDWDRAAVKADLSRPPNSWNDATIENNMFKKYDPAAVIATSTDPTSIMMYQIPKRWTRDGFSAGFNTTLSAKDKQLIQENYF